MNHPPAFIEEVKHVRVHSAVELEVASNTFWGIHDWHVISCPVHLCQAADKRETAPDTILLVNAR
jgi:hypothetical protein